MTKAWTLSEELQDRICDLLSEDVSMRRICEMEDMPSRRTVLRWLSENPSFAAKCARARSEQADYLNEDMAEIEEKTLTGEIDPAAARAVLASKQWRASKLEPKKYGAKVTQEHIGEGGGPVGVIQATVSIDDYKAARERIVSEY